MQPIIFVLGKPGSGKGTTCSFLQENLKIKHYSAGDLLREQVRDYPEDDVSKQIVQIMKDGKLVNPAITVGLLKRSMEKHPNVPGFLIDGFPRDQDQMKFFLQQFDLQRCFMLHLKCSNEECYERIHGRNSQRIDDNDDTIAKRLKSFEDETLRVIRYFGEKGKLFAVDAQTDINTVTLNCQRTLAHLVRPVR